LVLGERLLVLGQGICVVGRSFDGGGGVGVMMAGRMVYAGGSTVQGLWKGVSLLVLVLVLVLVKVHVEIRP
jgi:hypothetical protein